MSLAPPRIHPTAVVGPDAVLAPGVEVGPQVVIEGAVRLGPGCVVGPRACLIGPLAMGRDNRIGAGAVLGDRPQHLGYRGEPTGVEVGAGNEFGERVTVHRAAVPGGVTRIGSGNRFRAESHVAHDCHVGDGCTLMDGALLAGHSVLGDGAEVAAGCGVHQNCRVGRLAVVGAAITSKDVPPFVIQAGMNAVSGLNAGGMRAAGLTTAQVAAVGRAYRVVFLDGLPLPDALAAVEAELGRVGVVREFVAFIRGSVRGINRVREGGRGEMDHREVKAGADGADVVPQFVGASAG